MQEKILIFDFGSQYTRLIARKIRELNVYCEVIPYNKKDIDYSNVKGIVLSGSPHSVRSKNAPKPDSKILKTDMPLLGICYGAQWLAHSSGGNVSKSEHREYGRANLKYINQETPLLNNISESSQVWMSHADTITKLPDNFKIIAETGNIQVAAYEVKDEKKYGLQFHPEVYHSEEGQKILKNYVVDICGCKTDWTPDSFVKTTIEDLKNTLGNDKVVLGLSGGVDSSVAAVLLHKAIAKNLICIFVDNGLLRKNEFESVLESYKGMGLNVIGIDAKERFYKSLKGIEEPEQKRKAIGKTFIEVFDDEAHKIKDVIWLAQGTIYPDVIESESVEGPSVTIKSHHNVGGLPDFMKLKIVEPLRLLFKDEVRRVGKVIEVPEKILNRHPFPGPGLGIRILGEVTEEKIRILQEADKIFIDSLIKSGLYDDVWQALAVLLPVKSVGVMGDERTYENTIVLRAVSSVDGMTADWSKLPHEFLADVSTQIINKVIGVNRVVYDISSKPPSTIEWE